MCPGVRSVLLMVLRARAEGARGRERERERAVVNEKTIDNCRDGVR